MIRARKTIETLILERNREKYLKGDKTQNLKPEKIVYPGASTDQVSYDVEITPSSIFV